MKRPIAVVAVSSTVFIGLCAFNVSPAFADSRSYGAKSCAQGTIYSEARGNQTVRHEHLQNGVIYSKSFINGAAYQTDRYYTGLQHEDRATIQNGVGTITSASRNCAD